MNDRFKFRAKLKNMDEWIVGAYLKMLPYQPYPVGGRKPLETEYKHLIITEGGADWGMPREIVAYEVIPETVGQCTGLKDKNGKLIYEGDIVDKGTRCKWIITWFKNRFILVPDFEYKNKDKCASDRECGFKYFENNHSYADKDIEVIGNIYENKELLDERN